MHVEFSLHTALTWPFGWSNPILPTGISRHRPSNALAGIRDQFTLIPGPVMRRRANITNPGGKRQLTEGAFSRNRLSLRLFRGWNPRGELQEWATA